jgi:hypothetical protein
MPDERERKQKHTVQVPEIIYGAYVSSNVSIYVEKLM